MSTANARHIDTAVAAKMIRELLKKRFPAAKFSVRISRYSMGSSVDVYWIDGPSNKLVEESLAPFRTKSFDGMDDSTHYGTSWLDPDGDLTSERLPAWSAEEVYFSFYLSTHRTQSIDFARKCAAQVARFYGILAPDLQPDPGGRGWELPRHMDGHRMVIEGGLWSWFQALRLAAEDRTTFAIPEASTRKLELC